MDSPGEISALLAEMRSGRQDALGRLAVDIQGITPPGRALHARRASRSHTQPTALVHEAYLRLAGQERANWQNRAQFMGIAGSLCVGCW